MMKIALVGQVLAASSIVSKSSAVSDITIAFGFIRLFFSTTKTFGASVSQLPNAKQSDGSIIIRYRLSNKEVILILTTQPHVQHLIYFQNLR